MILLKTYLRMIFIRNKYNYPLVILSIASVMMFITMTMIYMDYVFGIRSEFIYPQINFIYRSVYTTILIGGMFFVFHQYFNIMKTGIRDYCIMKTLGATKRIIRLLIIVQEIVLLIITLPMGLFIGFRFSNFWLDSLGETMLNNNSGRLLYSFPALNWFIILFSGFIIYIGFYMEHRTSKLSLSEILSDNTALK